MVKTLKETLTPIKRENFQINFSPESDVSTTVEPHLYYSKLIAEIQSFTVGQYMWFVANLTNGSVQSVGGSCFKLLGISEEELLKSPNAVFLKTHPDDLKKIFAFTNQWHLMLSKLPRQDKSQITCNIYIRMCAKEHQYKWVLVQYIGQIYDPDGNVIFSLTLITDISHLKKSEPSFMTVIDHKNDLCHYFYCSQDHEIVLSRSPRQTLTLRESEVLKYIAKGYSSKQIATELNISTKTIENHRQNMLHKTNSKSSSELVNFAIQMGYM